MSESSHDSDGSGKRRIIAAGATAAVGMTAFYAFRELSRRHALSAAEALEKVADPFDAHHTGRVRVLAALLNLEQPCMVSEKLRAASGLADNAKYEQTLRSLTGYYLGDHALLKTVSVGECPVIAGRSHYELTDFATAAWDKNQFDPSLTAEIMAVRDELSGNS